MEDLRVRFHDIVNKLNKITIKTGLLVELSKNTDIDSLAPEVLRENYKKALEILAGAEQDALQAGKGIEFLKKMVYEQLKAVK